MPSAPRRPRKWLLHSQHDQAIWETLQACLGGLLGHKAAHARRLANLTTDMGGLGLHPAQRTAPAAYWAAWMDALFVLQARSPAFGQLPAIFGWESQHHAGRPFLVTQHWFPHCAPARTGQRSARPNATSTPLTPNCAELDPNAPRAGCKFGGRWNGEASNFVQDLAPVRSQRAPPTIRGCSHHTESAHTRSCVHGYAHNLGSHGTDDHEQCGGFLLEALSDQAGGAGGSICCKRP